MPFCINCGNSYEDECSFCSRCGRPITATVMPSGTLIEPLAKEQEVPILSTGANLFRGIEGVGGTLYLYHDRILFKPHLFNIQSQPLTLQYKAVLQVEKCNTALFIPNGLKIYTKDNDYRFVVNGRDNIISVITSQCQLHKP